MSPQPMDVVQDDIDTETLQAQIDLSMSLAHDLVTSWIKPADRAGLKSSLSDTQKMMEEQMRRPPRLGVGAPIPETSFHHEDAKLRYTLQGNGKGKKRERDESITMQNQSDEEEDSRDRMIGKKTKREDPFSSLGKKKRKKGLKNFVTGFPTPQATSKLAPVFLKPQVSGSSEPTPDISSEGSPASMTTVRIGTSSEVESSMSAMQNSSNILIPLSPLLRRPSPLNPLRDKNDPLADVDNVSPQSKKKRKRRKRKKNRMGNQNHS